MEFLIPRRERPLAFRPNCLAGRGLGVLWNGKPNADIELGRLRQIVTAHYGLVTAALEVKSVASAPAPPDIFQECDVVVNAIGD